jgi:hypothetical protein
LLRKQEFEEYSQLNPDSHLDGRDIRVGQGREEIILWMILALGRLVGRANSTQRQIELQTL